MKIQKLLDRSSGVQTLVFNNKRKILLILRSDFPVWTLPGGRIDKRERAIDAAKRELYEETGLQAKSLSSLGIFTVKFMPFAGRTEVFVVKKVTGKTLISAETKDIKYFSLDKLPWNLLPYLRKRIFKSIY